MEITSRNIFKRAEKLSKNKYKELRSTHLISLCDSILINKKKRTFFFTINQNK